MLDQAPFKASRDFAIDPSVDQYFNNRQKEEMAGKLVYSFEITCDSVASSKYEQARQKRQEEEIAVVQAIPLEEYERTRHETEKTNEKTCDVSSILDCSRGGAVPLNISGLKQPHMIEAGFFMKMQIRSGMLLQSHDATLLYSSRDLCDYP